MVADNFMLCSEHGLYSELYHSHSRIHTIDLILHAVHRRSRDVVLVVFTLFSAVFFGPQF